MIFIGIDPGLSGAYAWIDEKRLTVTVEDTPTLKGASNRRKYDLFAMVESFEFLIDGERCFAVVEQQQAMPKQGVSSTFSTGYGFAAWEMLLTALHIPYQLVKPARWKRDLGIPPKSDKSASMQMASRLWPDAPLRGPKGGAKDGRADALLLAEWGRRQNNTGGETR